MPYKDPEVRRAKQREYAQAHYLANKDTYKERAKENKKRYKERNYEYVNQIKADPCTDCNKTYPLSKMHFDHLEDNKLDNIADMVKTGYSIETIQAEINKCELVCIYCHSERTNERLQSGIRYNL